jgi:uncharacterized DUF497 family protein
MQIEFDPAKDTLNLQNHGLSLALAKNLEFDWLISHADTTRHDYFELRMIGFAPIGQTVYCAVYVEREEGVMRVISLREATKKEVRDYASQI